MTTTALARRTELELVLAQVQAVDAWIAARRASDAAAQAVPLTREMRLDVSRRTEARRREHQALVARADVQLREAGALDGPARTRAVLAHRSTWLRDGVARRLEERGITVVGAFDDGAEAAGTLVAEQPDVVLVEDRLPTLPGVAVVRRARRFAPDAVVGAQCLDGSGVQELADAGAHAVFTRRVPPAQIADQLVECLLQAATAGAE